MRNTSPYLIEVEKEGILRDFNARPIKASSSEQYQLKITEIILKIYGKMWKDKKEGRRNIYRHKDEILKVKRKKRKLKQSLASSRQGA